MSAEIKAKYGFFGLGAMGYHIAARLAEHCETLIVSDIDSAVVERFCNQSSARALTGPPDAQIVFLCLPDDEAVRSVVQSLPNGQPTKIVDFGAHSPDFVRKMADHCTEAGMIYCDVPVFGTPTMAERGELYFLFSGPRAEYDWFASMALKAGYRTRFAGKSGSASAVKVLQNALGTVNLLAGAEALRVCEDTGIDAQMFCNVVSECGGIGNSAVFEKFGVDMAARLDSGEGRLRIAAKDMAAAAGLTELGKGDAILIQETAKRFKRAYDDGFGDEQFSNIIKTL